MKWLSVFLAGFAVLSCSASFTGRPISRNVDVNAEEEALLTLDAAIQIPEPRFGGGQLNWPIVIPEAGHEGLVVEKISVKMNGLYHEAAGDLEIRLLHHGAHSMLSGNRGGSKRLGIPRKRHHAHISSKVLQRITELDQIFLPGKGFDYTFADGAGTNLAFGASGEQSSSVLGGETGIVYATDGSIHGNSAATLAEENPWFQIDLGSEEEIGTVMLWLPDKDNQAREIQIVKTTGLITLAGSFCLSLNFAGMVAETDPIAFNAVSSIAEEDKDSNESGIGAGESMQAKLQGMVNVGLVSVSRSEPDLTQGYEWTVTFISDRANISEMKIVTNNLTAGPQRLPEDQIADVTVTTVLNGTKHSHFNSEMSSGLVLVSNNSFGVANLTESRAMAHAEQSFSVRKGQKQLNILMPSGTRGRFVRVGLEQTTFLSMMEIMVFSESLTSFESYLGGSPIPGGSYVPELSFGEVFKFAHVSGEWILAIKDCFDAVVKNEDSAPQRVVRHGTGALRNWELEILARNQSGAQIGPISLQADVSALILVLPRYGQLFEAHNGIRGDLITPVPGTERISVPTRTQQIIYVPKPGFRGSDEIQFSSVIGSRSLHPSEIATLTLHVKKCRLSCNNDRLIGIKSRQAKQDLPQAPISAPPDKILQPEKFGARLWNDPYCANPPCNNYEQFEIP